jgi:hypothetical protein
LDKSAQPPLRLGRVIKNKIKNKELAVIPGSQKNWAASLAFCASHAHIIATRQGFAADALLGRFLPRLGPLVTTQAASLFAVAQFAAAPFNILCKSRIGV